MFRYLLLPSVTVLVLGKVEGGGSVEAVEAVVAEGRRLSFSASVASSSTP